MSLNLSTNPKVSSKSLVALANELRFRTILNSHLTETPHLGSCLSCVDMLVWLYWNILKVDPLNPQWCERDRFILSKGHAAPVLFQVLAERGFFPPKELKSYGQNGSLFGEHPPVPASLPGIEAATGSLGHGLPMGLGIALAGRIKKMKYSVYALLSDGECNEGAVWESALMASAQRVDNLTIFIDYNKWQATGRSDEVLGLAPFVNKWSAFGWATAEINGHSFDEMEHAVSSLAKDPRPKAIIAHTIKGKGIDFMENDNNWHYRIPTVQDVLVSAEILGIQFDQVQLNRCEPIIRN